MGTQSCAEPGGLSSLWLTVLDLFVAYFSSHVPLVPLSFACDALIDWRTYPEFASLRAPSSPGFPLQAPVLCSATFLTNIFGVSGLGVSRTVFLHRARIVRVFGTTQSS